MKQDKSMSAPSLIPDGWTKEMVSKMQNTEDFGTATYQAAQQLLLLVEQNLIRYHGFSEKEIKELEEETKSGLQTLVELEKENLSILTPHDMNILVEIAEIRKQRLSAGRSNISLPTPRETEKIKKLTGGDS